MQEIFTLGKKLQQSFTQEEYEQFLAMEEPSSLSSGVIQLLEAKVNNSEELPLKHYVDSDTMMLNWDAMPKKMTYYSEVDQLDDLAVLSAVHKASFVLRPIVESVHEQIHEKLLSIDVTTPEMQEILSYLPYDNLIQDMIRLYRSGQYSLCFAMGITFFERAVGDALLKSRKQQIQDDETEEDYVFLPGVNGGFRELKINEVLTSPDLEQFIGEDVVFLIRCFTGPLQSLNLRNLVWHGFLGIHEFYPSFASFLFVLIFSVGALPSIKGTKSVRKLSDIDFFMQKCGVSVKMTDYSPEHLTDIIEHSFFIAKNRLPDWKKAMEFFLDGEYYFSLILLLPLLEHSLRRLFAYLKNCTCDINNWTRIE
jgi:hypothetical protein